jgi:hypothetical protein
MGAVSSNAIADFLAEAAAGPSGLVIEGEAGIGKTTQGTFANKDYGQLIAPTLDTLANEGSSWWCQPAVDP